MEFEMYKVYRKDAYWWCKTILKYGLVVAFCSWLVSCYVESERMAEERNRSREESEKCNQKLAGMEHVPILGGGLLDISKIPGFYYSSATRGGLCIAEGLEGSFWWTGTELRPTYQELGKEPSPNRKLFSVIARLYTRTESTEPINMGRQTKEWPEDLIVKLKNYPGLELWLNAPPPSVENEFAVSGFIMRDWRRSDGTPRVIACDGLGFPSSEVLESGFSTEVLLTLNKSQLENLDFGRFNAFCKVELHSFDFAGGDARVRLGTGSLRAAPIALKFISDYLSGSIITGK
jgi:hypothetical protein